MSRPFLGSEGESRYDFDRLLGLEPVGRTPGSKIGTKRECAMNVKVLVLAMVGLSAEFAPALAQRDFSNVEIKATHVAGNVYMLTGSGGNIGVSVGDDGVLMVDDQFAPLADKIRAALKELGKGKLKFVLNTHWHGDHTGGNVEFGPEAPIIAQTNVRERLSTTQHILNNVYEPSPKEALPVITFDESLSIHFNGEEIKVLHYPHSHTDGDSIVYFTRSNVIHMGDCFFSGMFPFVDLKSGGDVEGLSKTVEAVIAKLPPGVKIIPGHGPLSTPDDLKAFGRMLKESTKLVRERIAAGKTVAQIRLEGMGDEWKSWGEGFIDTRKWLDTVYDSLEQDEP